jgi:hypothetical protein
MGSVSWLQTSKSNRYILMEYTPKDPNKPVMSVIFYTDTFNIRCYVCARYKLSTKDFGRVKNRIVNFPGVMNRDTAKLLFYEIMIFENKKLTRYCTGTPITTLKLFDAIVDTIPKVETKQRLDSTLKYIQQYLN